MDARIRFYKILQCGYYEKEDFCFGSLSEVLENLREWIKDKTLSETQTYSVDPNDNESDVLSTYCYSVTQKDNDFLLITWNQNADVDGKMASVNILEKTGEASVETAEPSDGFMPGYPSFFWFVPSKNIFATIQFNTSLNGKKNLDHYLKCFLERQAKYVVYHEEEGSYNIVGYGSKDDYRLSRYPRFSSVLYREKGKIDYIRKNREYIRKFIKKDKLIHERAEHIDSIQSLFDFFMGKGKRPTCATENKINIEIDYKPTEDELENIILKWQQDSALYPASDVGFWIEGNSQPFWLRQSLASDTFDLDVHFLDKNVLVKPDDLLNELHRKQDIIFNVLES